MRQKRFKMKEPTRFKVTNYQPAAEAFQNYLAKGEFPSQPPNPEEQEEDIEETKLNQSELAEEVFDIQEKGQFTDKLNENYSQREKDYFWT